MILRAYRLCLLKHAEAAFSGEGARLFGGRWNSPGVPVVYAADSLSLAQLETLVRLSRGEQLRRFVCVMAEFPARLVTRVEELGRLPDDWKAQPPSPSTQRLGNLWARQGGSAVLSVPSVVTPGERNWVFNPRHPDFLHVSVHPAQEFRFDLRLLP